jgi:hypothetical protein
MRVATNHSAVLILAFATAVALTGCQPESPSPRVIAPRPVAPVHTLTGVIGSSGSEGESTGGDPATARTVVRRVIGVRSGSDKKADEPEERDIVIVDSTQVIIDGKAVTSPYLGPKMGAIQRADYAGKCDVTASYVTSSGPQLGLFGKSYPVATRIVIVTHKD